MPAQGRLGKICPLAVQFQASADRFVNRMRIGLWHDTTPAGNANTRRHATIGPLSRACPYPLLYIGPTGCLIPGRVRRCRDWGTRCWPGNASRASVLPSLSRGRKSNRLSGAAMIADDFRQVRPQQGTLIESTRQRDEPAVTEIERFIRPNRRTGKAAFGAMQGNLLNGSIHESLKSPRLQPDAIGRSGCRSN